MRTFFISGIDTGVGKTVATGLMARWLALSGRSVATVKMVQTGNDGFSEDIRRHRELCGGIALPEDAEGLTAPQIFRFPSSPALAASLEGRKVDVEAISAAVKTCASRYGFVLVESAGGLDVPLTDEMLSVDLAAREGWPLVLVTRGRLGSINHSLLSLEAAKSRGMEVAGVVHDWCEGADPEIDRDAVETVRRHMRRLGFRGSIVAIPRLEPGGPLPDVDFSPFFG